jgi:hypothetical protein
VGVQVPDLPEVEEIVVEAPPPPPVRRPKIIVRRDICSPRVYRRELREHRRELRRLQKDAADCGDEESSCVDSSYKLVIEKKRLLARFKRSYSESCTLDLTETHRRCRSRRYLRLVKRLGRHKKRLVRWARRCRLSNKGCTRRYARRIHALNKRLRRHRLSCSGRRRNVCSRRFMRRWMRRMRDRRSRLHSLASTCDDEDQACVARNARRVLRLNKRIDRRRKQCKPKAKKAKKVVPTKPALVNTTHTWLTTDTEHHVITKSVWLHAIDCEEMRNGFARWLAFMRRDRKRIHDNICKDCSPRDAECIKERYRRIMDIQRGIRRGRSEYTELVTKCDRCAPLRLRFERWVKLQTARRVRLHNEICKCAEDDVKCVVRRVLKIKRIQQRIKDGRKHIFHLNEHCVDDADVLPVILSVNSTAVRSLAVSASMSHAGVATLLAVALAALFL